jgi:hypothetical protein
MTRLAGFWLVVFQVSALAQSMPAPQYATISAPAPGRNSCSFARTPAVLTERLQALKASGMPQVDFAHQKIAVVATTSDGSATPSQMGPSASNGQTLVLTFKRSSGGNSGVFVFSVDASSAGGFTSCSVSYPPIPRAASSVSIR